MSDVTPVVRLRQLIRGFQPTHLIYAAAELGIADHLADTPKTSAELASLVGAHAGALHRVLRALAQLGVLTSREDECFGLTPMGELLRSDVPESQRYHARLWGHALFQRPYLYLLHTIKTGEVAFDHTYGQEFFSYLADHPEEAAIFDRGMAGGSAPFLQDIVAAHDYSNLGTIVDVGGGNGAVLTAILRAYPAARGVVFDLPHVQEVAEQTIAAAGLAGRCTFIAGSFFEAVPPDADAYMLKSVIHDWDDTDSVAILTTCRRAMPPHARVLLVERVLPPADQPALDTVLQDIQMLLFLKGRERTEADFRALFEQAGLRLARTIPLKSGVHMLEATPA